jgi:hypothetical protein
VPELPPLPFPINPHPAIKAARPNNIMDFNFMRVFFSFNLSHGIRTIENYQFELAFKRIMLISSAYFFKKRFTNITNLLN